MATEIKTTLTSGPSVVIKYAEYNTMGFNPTTPRRISKLIVTPYGAARYFARSLISIANFDS